MRVVLTRERGMNESAASWLPAHAVVDEVPLTTSNFVEPSIVADELRASSSYGGFTALVVTSARSARYALLATTALASGAEVLSVGPTTTRALLDEGLTVHVQSAGRALDLERQIEQGPVLLLGAATTSGELTRALAIRDVEVVEIACYETCLRVLDAGEQYALGDADVIFIGAPSAWRAASAYVDPTAWVVVPGVTTGVAVRATHERVIEGWGPSVGDRLNELYSGD